jgi:hypothetical protein
MHPDPDIEARRTFEDLRQRMLGMTIVHKRLFLDTLQLYLLADKEGDRAASLEIWCESPWQLLSRGEVLADSTKMAEGDDPTALQPLVSQEAQILVDRTIEDIHLGPQDHSLRIFVAGGFEIRTYPPEDADLEQWLLRGPAGTPEVGGWEDGVRQIARDSKGHRL